MSMSTDRAPAPEGACAKPLRILQLEDEPKDGILVRAALEGEDLTCEVKQVDSRADFAAALKQGDFDLILSDYSLPGFDGLAALRLARTLAPDVPFIFVSGTLGEEAAIEAVRNGATDYVLKHRLSHLAPAVRRAIKEAQERERRRQTEEALRQSEDQLRQAQKMEAIGRLAAGVAHDFNNILTAILGHAQLAQARLGHDHPAASDLVEVRRAGERAATLTRRLLAFTRQQVLQPRPLDLNAMILELDKMLRRVIGSDVELRTCPGEGVGPILADPSQIEQVLLNLVINARDAMPHGGRLTIETAEVVLEGSHAQRSLAVPGGRYVMLAVSDDGIGMEADVKALIFEPFFTTKEPGKGTGLGLSTVFGIVKQSGGGIEVTSQPGEGTTFKLYFPQTDARGEADDAPKRTPGAVIGTETVLVVEDEDAVRALTCRTLAAHGYRVHEARDGHEAIGVLEDRGRGIDLLLTDVVLPAMGAAELIARAAYLRPGMKVLCVSGYAEGAIVHQGVLVAGTPFLQKPFTPEALAVKVREVLDTGDRLAA